MKLGLGAAGALGVAAVALYACSGERATLPLEAGIGPAPTLPAPVPGILPTTRIASVVGWPAGATPTPAAGLKVEAFATGLDHPRWLLVLPNGDVLVAETNGPQFAAEFAGIRGFFAKRIMSAAGAGDPSPNKIVLLRAGAGGAQKFTFADHLFSPFGMALVGNDVYVANTDAVIRFAYTPGATSVAGPGVKLTDLPGGPIDHHWTKSLLASADGTALYVGVGSNSNVGENGLPAEEGRAAIWKIDRATGAHTVFAGGLRNPVGLAWEPRSGALWTAVNERDEIGSDLVPDYMTHVQQGAFYGWPWSYYGQHVDTRVKPERPDMVARAIPPDYALGPHTASLGLAFAPPGQTLGAAFAEGAFVGQHGSWNREPPSGYKVLFVPFRDGKPAGQPVDVLTGFLNAKGEAQGRPVGVAFAADGSLLVADDVGNTIWRVTAATPGA